MPSRSAIMMMTTTQRTHLTVLRTKLFTPASSLLASKMRSMMRRMIFITIRLTRKIKTIESSDNKLKEPIVMRDRVSVISFIEQFTSV